MTDHIFYLARGYVRLRVGDKTVRVLGERFLPRPDSPNFVAGLSLVDAWEDGSPVSARDRESIADALRESFASRGTALEFE